LKIHRPQLDFTEGQGVNYKISGDFFGVELFFNGKIRWTGSTIRGLLRALVHDGLAMASRRGLARARPSSRSGAWQPTGGGTTERGVHGESISGLTGAPVVVWRPANGGEEMVEEALGASGAWVQREEKQSGERCGGERRASPFV
jgi:hypothetical protein